MRMNGAGIGMIMATTVKVLETTQPVLRRAISAFFAVVLGVATTTSVGLLAVAATTALATATTTLVSVLCVPVLIKN